MTLSDQNIPILTVSQLSNAIKMSLESTFPTVYLQGEVSNAKPHSSGHFYFTLKDAQAQIGAVMFRAEAQHLKALPKEGAQVLVRGELNVYPPQGKYQLIVKELRPVGMGELLLKLEELKVKLQKLGYFRKERKRPLPHLPRRIGVVTSPTGAAIQDMLNILTRRFSGFHLILNPVKVQGEGAAQEIAQAIQQFNAYQLVDVLIVGRGGGSIEDLWAFNEEVVAQAIYNSQIPIISAVGHETDHCIADYVADVRAPTPSAAAELVIADKAEQIKHLGQLQHRLHQALHHHIRHQRQRLAGLVRQPVLQSPYGILAPWIQKTDHLREEIEDSLKRTLERKKLTLESLQRHVQALKPTAKITHFRQRLASLDKSLQNALATQFLKARKQLDKRSLIDPFLQRQIALCKERLAAMTAALHSIDPKNLLTKGYAIVMTDEGRSVVTSIHTLTPDQKVRILLADGQARATIQELALNE
jgi:exodeoxyribonuclease VII large subunit